MENDNLIKTSYNSALIRKFHEAKLNNDKSVVL